MDLEIILSVASGLWLAVMVLVISLCRAAKQGDEAMDWALADAIARATHPEHPLRELSLDQAASLLGVGPQTLLAWDARYGFPTSTPAEPLYNRSEVLALRDCLEEGLSIASAVIRAREQTKRRRALTATRVLNHRDGGVAS